MANVTGNNVKQFIRDNVDKSSRILTDESAVYNDIGYEYAGGHETVCHSKKEYVRGDVHSNTIEGFFSIVKRGLNGIYHSVSREHLGSYMAEFEFRYNYRHLDDGARTVKAIHGAEGKRLLYKDCISN